ncbi:MAG TPA: MFS transporter, partial [Anaerolineales bacterium]|nr:MFS transporter [Anaerolineales bacterium]
MKLINSFKTFYGQYPRQYWLMIAGIIISTAGGSMILPFLVIYAGNKLNMPLSTVAALISINAGTGLISSFIAGTLADKVGRKAVMVFSLAVNGIAYLLLIGAENYLQFAGLMMMIGASNPLYQVGADAMLADMIPSEQRTDAYAITRIANNAAFAVGPAMGGFLATRSYNLAFYGASLGFITYSLLLFFRARETLVIEKPAPSFTVLTGNNVFQSYARVFQNKPFIIFVALVSLGLIAPTMLWILMPVYAKTNYGIPEALYGWIPTTNALMCVFIQYFVTRITRGYQTLPVVGVGILVYAVGTGS